MPNSVLIISATLRFTCIAHIPPAVCRDVEQAVLFFPF